MPQFRYVDVRGHGPFGECATLHLRAGLNVIVGSNGSGKTTVVRELRRQYAGWSESAGLPGRPLLPADLVFLDETCGAFRCHSGLQGLGLVAGNLDLARLEADLGAYFRQLLPPERLRAGHMAEARFRVQADGDVTLERGGELTPPSWLAWGERFLFELAWNRALRAQLDPEGECPFVLDDLLCNLDRELTRTVAAALPGMARQVVLLSPHAIEWALPGTRVDYEIGVFDAPLGHVIERVIV